MISRRIWVTLVALVVLTGCNSKTVPTNNTDVQSDGVAATAELNETSIESGGESGEAAALVDNDALFPSVRESSGFTVLLYPPQIRAWPDFAQLDAELALEITGPGNEKREFGTARLSGDTEVLLADRIVRVTSPTIEGVEFVDGVPDEYRDAVLDLSTRDSIDIPLDLFLAYLADDLLSNPPPPGFNMDPPPIAVRYEPTVLLFVNGGPVGEEIGETGMQRIVNANWPLFASMDAEPVYYLLARDQWLMTTRLDDDWVSVETLPAAFDMLPDAPEYQTARATLPYRSTTVESPDVMFASSPAELIVIDGPATRAPVEEAGRLEFVSNTESLLFVVEERWYFLVAGRWFSTPNLDDGPWSFVAELPADFSMIPPDHARGEVRVSVPGTIEARMAALEAMLPTKVTASVDAAAPIEVTYAGEPEFEAVPGTSVLRAANTPYDVIQHEDDYYLLYSGIWYQSMSPAGPWGATGILPDAIYEIPPSSPAYAVTQVTVIQATPTTIIYSYPPSYSTGVYVVYGVPYYGTGWYYAPYIWGRYYFPHYVAYGYGSWYNPATGGYGSRSVWVGPYGGYSYNQGYNPATGRYGYVETAWDGDEWASSGQTYNPRTGISTETSRYYDDDKQRSQMERTVERGDNLIRTEREIDFDNQTSRTQRTASSGGSSDISRSASDGTITSSGEIRTGDGREFAVSGQGDRTGGSTSISGSTGSATIDTDRRADGSSISRIEGSDGGSGISASGQGPGRTTIGQSGSGDLYAGRNGNVYKKSDEGWQNYQDGGWQDIDTPERGTSSSDPFARPADRQNDEFARNLQGRDGATGDFSRDQSRLDRDYGARQRGLGQYEQRNRMAGSRQRSGGRGRRR